MKDDKLVMGVLGLGEGRSVISAVQKSSYYELGNICDLNDELCKKRVKEFGLSKYTTRYEDMLADDSIDVIGIYTPDQFHAKHIKQALKAGKHVICTKPVMIGLDQAKDLVGCEKESGKLVFVGQSSRFFEPLKRQRELYEEKNIGELISVETHYKNDSRWFLERDWSRQPGFSWMYNFMIHAVDLATWYIPEIEEVFGYGSVSPNMKSYNIHTEDTMSFVMKDKSGHFATVEGAYGSPCLDGNIEFPIECTLRGTTGISRGGYSKLKYYERTIDETGRHDRMETYDDKHDFYFRFEKENHHAGEYQNYIEYFARCLQKNMTPKPDLSEAIHTIGIMEAMKRSLTTGMPVKVSELMREYELE
ncbi:Gfo/Idh/MocA family oxidoreductase [Blautia liquoris]|uniref:Gfo/Idh/MocA family oxidoreductase n=1 Tax=Blautia liquoris TaxID=2779518 RepID=A0A7M2RIX6_9FIRM|nr:Gfo/Idh/MocA family oxidoreductase [Blautia liquoris]QOV20255.1 Gfo/Idh/MocA family oxidoreductase [Blautia liquoris]